VRLLAGTIRGRLLAALTALTVGTLAVTAAATPDDLQPIVVLVSFDGWRSDYIDRADVPNLKALAARGSRAAALVPSFPTKTFPNHYTIVTGLYPEHHGIVSNVIVDPGFPQRFTLSAKTATDPRWWGGEAVWATAMRQGRRAASMFWPGSDVEGRHPTYWTPYDERLPNAQRVKTVIGWLALPEPERPAFVTLYFSDVDSAGHMYGPDSQHVLNAAARVDAALGELVNGAAGLKLLDRIDFVIVSDHGMSQLSDSRVIFLDDYIDLKTVDVIEWAPNLGLAPRSGTAEDIVRTLKGRHPALSVYVREQTPPELHYRSNDRIPPVVGLAADGWTITSRARHAAARAAGRVPGGDHGYDPKYPSMHGLFVAAGPHVRTGVVVPSLQNIHIYGLLCALLGITPAPNDGDPGAARQFLID
jgi:predicted AlkP superfamily pyrophosphatase or phosphodiesterase